MITRPARARARSRSLFRFDPAKVNGTGGATAAHSVTNSVQLRRIQGKKKEKRTNPKSKKKKKKKEIQKQNRIENKRRRRRRREMNQSNGDWRQRVDRFNLA